MPAFDYTAYNPAGKTVSGTISADSPRQARRLLKEQQLIPASVSETSPQKLSGKKSTLLAASVSTFDLSLLLRQIAILTQSGLPVEEALRMTSEQAETAKQRKIVESWRSLLLEGRSLSESMHRAGFRVPDSVIAGIAVGEESGHLSQVMMQLADELEVSAENRKTVTRALTYPVILVVVSIIIVTFLMVWVVPKILVIFESSDQQLPLVTRIIVALSNYVQHYGLMTLVAIVIFFIVFKLWLRVPSNLLAWHRMLLSMPGLGRWIRMGSVADWARSLGILLQSGVPALAALGIASSVVNNRSLRSDFEGVTEAMRKGSSLHKALEAGNINSGFLVHMVGSGEASSELDKMLLRVADYYSLRLKSAVEVFLKIMNPLIIVFMGGLILMVVAAVMLPIMNLNNLL